MNRLRLLAVVFLLCASLAQAQTTQSTPTTRGARGRGPPPPLVTSPEIGKDRTVTLRFIEPNAKTVLVTGDMAPDRPIPMMKNAAGVWTVKIGPLAPDIYMYSLSVDGTKIADPSNADVKLFYESLAIVPGEEPMPWEMRDVPHGTLSLRWYESKLLGLTRPFYVYTPPGYEGGTDRYPVLFLLHGWSDPVDQWTIAGRANLIADNLIADHQCKPAILVMPYGQLNPYVTAAQSLNSDFATKYPDEITSEIVPLIDRDYRTLPDASHRGLAGVSLGGLQTANIGFAHAEVFGSLGIWSPPLFGDPAAVFKKISGKHTLIHLGCGQQDGLLARSTALDQWLSSQTVAHEFHPIPGRHHWPVWRRYLVEFLPKFTSANN